MKSSRTSITQRKVQHIALARKTRSQMNRASFSSFTLPYHALPECDLHVVDTSITLFGKRLAQPLVIASMTGGEAHAKRINRNIARAAQEANVAFGVGSQRIMLRHKAARSSFTQVRKYAPDAVIFGNVGAVQFNYGMTVDDVRYLVDSIEADALYLHLNPLQEALQPEGDTNFSDLLKSIESLISVLQVPVFIKEVGHGMCSDDAARLLSVGVSGIDIAGAGGTSWASIEAKRAENALLEEWFRDYGISTEQALEAIAPLKKQQNFTLIASGGIRNPLEGLHSLFMGADCYSAAFPFLEPAIAGHEQLYSVLKTWERGLRIALFTAGITSLPVVRGKV